MEVELSICFWSKLPLELSFVSFNYYAVLVGCLIVSASTELARVYLLSLSDSLLGEESRYESLV